MAPRKAAALVATLALVFAACGDDDSDDAAPTTTESSSTERAADGAGAELADDVAATVDGVEVATGDLDEQVEALAENPEIGPQLEGEQGDQLRDLIRAEALTAAILTQVALDGAEELGRPVTDEDVAESRGELETQAGGADALAEAIAGQGLTEASVDVQLRGLAALHNVEEALAAQAEEGQAGDEPADEEATTTTAPAGDDAAPELSPEAQAAQEYLMERLAGSEIVVNDDYGTWDADAAQVVPPGGLPAPPGSVPGG